MKRKLLIVTSAFPRWEDDSTKPGYFYELCQYLSKFYTVYVIAPHEFCAAKHQNENHIHIIRFKYFCPAKWQVLSSEVHPRASFFWKLFRAIQFPFFIIAEIAAIIRTMLSEEIDIVITHNFFPHSLLYWMLKPFLRKPHVATIDTSESAILKKSVFLSQYFINRMLASAECVVLHNSYIRYCLEKLTKKSFSHTIIPAGINTVPFTRVAHKAKIQQALGLPRDKKVFLFIGKLTRQQGIHVLLEAANLLRNQYDNFVLLVFADGPLRKTIQKWIRRQAMQDMVFFSHIYDRSFLPDYFALSDALVIPSIVDENGYTDVSTELILQGLAAGIPIIASRIADLINPLKDGYNGWLFEQGKYGALAEKMKNVLQESSLKTINKNAQESIKEYSWDTIADTFYQTINQLLLYRK